MRPFFQSVAGGFIGKTFATIVIAICTAFGFGPDRWAAAMIGGLPISLVAARVVFLLVVITAIVMWIVNWLHTNATQKINNIPIADALNYIVNGSAAELRAPHPKERFLKPRLGKWPSTGHNDVLKQLSADLACGRMIAWGIWDVANRSRMPYPTPDGVVREIPRDYWDKAVVRRPYCFKVDPKEWQTDLRGAEDGPCYTSVQVSKSQVIAHWPKASWWKRQIADWRGEFRRNYWATEIDKKYRRVGE